MAKFLTELDARLKRGSDTVWVIKSRLTYDSDKLGRIKVPEGFETDFASVPRVPLFYALFGDKAHREAVLHDYLYRTDSVPVVKRSEADDLFLEAMKVRGKSYFTRYGMYWGVRMGDWTAYHKKKVGDKL
jgi:hypothetical protein